MSHAILSPSSAKRWLLCPGSVSASAGIPDSKSEHAEEGTAAHWVGEQMLLGRWEFPDTAPNGVPITPDMIGYVKVYTDYVQRNEASGLELMVEQQLPLQDLTGEVGAHGTADTVLVGPGYLEVVDLKYGRGVEVDPSDPQLGLYLLSAFDMLDAIYGPFKQLVTTIVQPRISSKPKIHTWTLDQLAELRADVHAAAVVSRMSDAPRNPSTDACRWCRAKTQCEPAMAFALTLVDSGEPNTVASPSDFVDLTAPKPEGMNPQWLSLLVTHAPMIRGLLDAAESEAGARLLLGQDVPGFKLVKGKGGRRHWTDEAAAADALKKARLKVDQIYTRKVISPTDAEKLHKAGAIKTRLYKAIEALVARPEGGPTLAPITDPRPAYSLTAAPGDFDDVSNII